MGNGALATRHIKIRIQDFETGLPVPGRTKAYGRE